MDLDFIKWMVGYAKGFELDEDYLDSPGNECWALESELNYVAWKEVYYPLLLQRAIEGINRDHEIEIVQEAWCIALLKLGKSLPHFEIVGNPDQAKEAALKYIYEQEKSNG